jgi:hypothetical protein
MQRLGRASKAARARFSEYFYEIEYQKSGITIAEFPLEPLHDFMSYKTFRAELIEALTPYGVETDRFSSDMFWRSFIHYYSSVIQDCPLDAIDNNIRLVTHVSGQAWPMEMAQTIYRGPVELDSEKWHRERN